ncbi:MAG: transcriptional regulator, TrmB [Herbinix sp.]|jgi:predicted transcriptional regulator|nr:transcriptional regulator, TrmB [Herbinix sp.]
MKIMKKRILLDLNKKQQTALIGKALSSEIRLDILRLLIEKVSNVSEIASIFNIPLSSAALHIKVLEEAKLITTQEKPGVRGAQKVCGIAFEDIYFNAFMHMNEIEKRKTYRFEMPIGNYYDCNIEGRCGIISEKTYLGIEDSPYSFFTNDRFDAQLIWFDTGYIEYRFPSHNIKNNRVAELSFSFEICSEAPGYQNDWPSDISIWINNHAVATIYSAGDYGDRTGRLNPLWWSDTMTQYGILKTLTINSLGCFEDSVKCSEHTLSSLGLDEGYYISFKIGVKPDAENAGGLNIFGEKFGDHPQGIVMNLVVDHEEEQINKITTNGSLET